MVEIADFKDEESFEAWLNETNQPQQTCAALAARMAMRVLPAAWLRAMQQEGLSPLPFLRASLVAGVAGLAPSAVSAGRGQASALRAATAANAAADAAHAGRAARSTAYAAFVAAAKYAASSAAAYAADAAAYTAFDTDLVYDADANADAWAAIRSDCVPIQDRLPLRDLPLFPSEPFGGLELIWSELKRDLRDNDWSFWLDWYMRMLEGRQQNWPLLLEIAIQEDDFWQGSDAEVNARIADLVEKHAIAASEVGESIQLTQIDGEDRFESVPKSDLPADMFTDAIERTRDAVEEVRAAHNYSSASRVLDEELTRIERYLERYADRPMRLYEVLMRTLRRVADKRERGALESDALLNDFVVEIENSALDILQNDQNVKDAIRLRASVKFDRLSAEEQEHFRGLMEFLAGKSVPPLASDMRKDGAAVVDPGTAEDDRNEAFVRSGGRALRMKQVGWHVFQGVAGASSIIGMIITLLS